MIISRNYWVYQATAYNHVYSDSGIFCIHSSASPKYAYELVRLTLLQFLNLTPKGDSPLGEVC